MRLKEVADNGNVVTLNRREAAHINFHDRSWISNNSNSRNVYDSKNNTDNTRFNANFNIYATNESVSLDNTRLTDENYRQDSSELSVVCNRQYRLNTGTNLNFLISCENLQTTNLEGATETAYISRESFQAEPNASTSTTPLDEEQAFDPSDTDEMSDHSTHPVPRGIVNPNYPGFQHLAHTLQDYSATIENYYPSENEMTDDDIELEITETTYETEYNISIEYKNDNDNNGNDEPDQTSLLTQKELFTQSTGLDSHSSIPDLLKSVSKNNNSINTIEYDTNCSEADIENNFHTKNIIGDFNKEVEEEIKQLLNYNINIQEDLEELRKDIKDTFAKPIETTINNISEVVNHVIKKLVETQSDTTETYETNNLTLDSKVRPEPTDQTSDINEQNELNTKTEMRVSRPTFLLLKNNVDEKITDAFLSDGKEEITVYENDYDTETLTNNVERTIKQLSTELRKIIPKLDEMRECDRIWNESKIAISPMLTDGNLNEIATSSKPHNLPITVSPDYDAFVNRKSIYSEVVGKAPLPARIDMRASRNRQKTIKSANDSFRKAQFNTSVPKAEIERESDLGAFDVYNIETALPKLDLDAIENHLKAAKEEERRKRNDREEIRRRLAMGADSEDYYSMGHIERPGRKPSLHTRLQNGMNLQICFMNETASDNESQASDVEKNLNSTKSLSRSSIFSKSSFNHPYQTRPLSVNITKQDKMSTTQSVAKIRPTPLSSKTPKSRSAHSLGHIELKESDFYALQSTLQTEARIALAQAKEIARRQMERERRSRPVSPVTEMLRRSMEKASAPLAPDRRRVSRQLLTDMNIAQLQVIVNELHSQIEGLNESLVTLLMARDDLHMGQDSMLVDIEDLTRYLGVKEQTKKTKGNAKSAVRRLSAFVNK